MNSSLLATEVPRAGWLNTSSDTGHLDTRTRTRRLLRPGQFMSICLCLWLKQQSFQDAELPESHEPAGSTVDELQTPEVGN